MTDQLLPEDQRPGASPAPSAPASSSVPTAPEPSAASEDSADPASTAADDPAAVEVSKAAADESDPTPADGHAPNPVRLAVGVVVLVVALAVVVAVPMILGRMASSPADDAAADDASTEASAPAAEGGAFSEADELIEGADAAPDQTNGTVGPDGEPVPSEPIVAEGAGYASAADVLAAMAPGLNQALAAPDNADAMHAWTESALSFAPADFVSAWAAERGAESLDALAAQLTDTEVATLAATAGAVTLAQGDPCSADERAAVEDRFRALGIERYIQAAYRAVATPLAADPAAGDGDADGAETAAGTQAVETAYCVVKINDAWYFFPTTFEARS